jgi:hypothetical protein
MISAIFAANTEAFRLEAELEKVIKERDEARQLCCRMSAQFVYLSNELCTAKFVANEKGWDCFKEDNHNA